MCGGQVLIIMVAGPAFKISPYKQTAAQWGYAIILGFISIPVGMVIRLIPDRLIERLVPDYLKRRVRDSRVPGLTVSDDDERFNYYPAPYAEVRDELAWLKRVKGGRLRNLKFAMKHPREAFQTMGSRSSRSPSHSRSGSIRAPITPEREDSTMSYGGTTISGVPATHGATTPVSAGGNGATSSGAPPSPDNRKRSRSMRSRSNSALGAPTVMAGIIAAGVAANWSPVDPRRMMGGGSGDDHAQQQQPIGGPSSSSGEAGPSGTSTSVLGGHLSDEPGSIDSPVAATHPDKLSLAVPSKAAVKGGDDRKSLS